MSYHPQRTEYLSRINRVMDYVEQNLDADLPLTKLAQVAHFSPFHFHRIFKAMVGESLRDFISRLRLEKAAMLLIQEPDMTVTAISLDCGFQSSAAFARTFKDTYQMSATLWRQGGYKNFRKIGKMQRNYDQHNRNFGIDYKVTPFYSSGTYPLHWEVQMDQLKIQVEVTDIPEMHVAYIRHIGPYQGDNTLFRGLFQKLYKWAGPRGLMRFPETKTLTVYHDNPELTDESKLRISVAITVPKDTKAEGEVGIMSIPGGKYAIAHFKINQNEYGAAWDAVMGGWLPESGYQPDDRLCFEIYLNDPEQDPLKQHVVDIYEPVKPL